MSHHATCAADPHRPRTPGDTGTAMFTVLALMLLVSVLGLGLALTSSLEPVIVSAYESAMAARYGAEAGVFVAAHELGDIPDWNLALSGQRRSAILDSAGPSALVLPDGRQVDLGDLTNLADCGHTSACTEAELNAFTTDRPWGPNNPRWHLFGHARLDRLLASGAAVPPCEVVVWVGDDPAETDGDPLRDSAPAAPGSLRPGAGLIALRVESFGVRSAHRVLVATIGRPEFEGDGRPRVVSWQEIR